MKKPDEQNLRGSAGTSAHTPNVPPSYATRACYSSNAALSFNRSIDRRGQFCIAVDGALRLSGNQSFNWREKLTIQLSADEVLSLVAQFLESCSHIVFVHGANGALKRLTLERQSHGYFARLSFNRTFCQLPISHSQQAGLVAFLVDDWRGAYPRLSDHQADMILKMLRNQVRKAHNCAQ